MSDYTPKFKTYAPLMEAMMSVTDEQRLCARVRQVGSGELIFFGRHIFAKYSQGSSYSNHGSTIYVGGHLDVHPILVNGPSQRAFQKLRAGANSAWAVEKPRGAKQAQECLDRLAELDLKIEEMIPAMEAEIAQERAAAEAEEKARKERLALQGAAEDLYAAAMVITLTPAIREFLEANDPVALAQVNAAIQKATISS